MVVDNRLLKATESAPSGNPPSLITDGISRGQMDKDFYRAGAGTVIKVDFTESQFGEVVAVMIASGYQDDSANVADISVSSPLARVEEL